jgi:hypothetical protein
VNPEVLDPVAPLAGFTSSIPEFVLKSIPLIIAVMALCRALSEVLLAVSRRFQAENVGKIGAVLGKVADVGAHFLALFGFGMPKQIMMAKAEKVALKELASGTQASDVKTQPPVASGS